MLTRPPVPQPTHPTHRYLSPDPLGLAPAPNPAAYVGSPHVWSAATRKIGWIVDHKRGTLEICADRLAPPIRDTCAELLAAARKAVALDRAHERLADAYHRFHAVRTTPTGGGVTDDASLVVHVADGPADETSLVPPRLAARRGGRARRQVDLTVSHWSTPCVGADQDD